MTTLRLKKSIGRSSSRLAFHLIPLVFACFALSPMAQAVTPPPDGAYPGQNTAEGDNALFSLSPTDGAFNTAIGWRSLFANTTGSLNTGVGAGTLFLNTSHNNTAVGAGALALNSTGDGNTANGALALLQNTVGRGNTAVGAATLFSNTEGAGNTAIGAQALKNNAPPVNLGDSSLNTAVGLNALTANTTGGGNTAVGAGPGVIPQPSPEPPIVVPAALGSNTSGGGNTAVGATTGIGPAALGNNTTGSFNTAIGAGGAVAAGALGKNTEGSFNTAIGHATLNSNTTGAFNTAIGPNALGGNTTGGSNLALGFEAGVNLTTGNNNIDIGNEGVPDEANTIRIGTRGTQMATFIAGISGTTASGGAAVFVNADGQLGTLTSSARFKDEIKPMDKASKAILALKPVTFRYKKGIDPQRIPQFGLVAEEVEKVNSDLVVRDKEGKPYTVRYEAVNAMLLNEFLKEHSTVQELKKEVAALTAGLQKVSAQLEASKPAPQVVNNNP